MRHRSSLWGAALVGGLMLTLMSVSVGAEHRRPVLAAPAAASPTPCPVSRPNADPPPEMAPPGGDLDQIGGYGNDALWTNLWMWGQGQAVLEPDPAAPDGPYPAKWAWYRYAPGRLTIEGRRLDAEAPPLHASVPDGYGDLGFQVSGLDFPTPGCWEITGHLGDASLTFVLDVVVAPDAIEGTPHAVVSAER